MDMAKSFAFCGERIQLQKGGPTRSLWAHNYSREDIRRHLTSFAGDDQRSLRALLLDSDAVDVHLLCDDQVLDTVAARIQTGRIGAIALGESKRPKGGGGGGTGETAEEAATAAPKRDAPKKTWIEVKLVNAAGEPVPGAAYRLTVTDGRVMEGRLGDDALLRVSGIDPGDCTLTFPELEAADWEAAP